MTLKERLRAAAKKAVVAVRDRGDAVECPVCGGTFGAFRTYNGRPDAQCPTCGALERHRLLWLHLEREGHLASPGRVLHVAPEPMFAERLRPLAAEYVSFDLESLLADVHGDLTDAPFEDGSFDLVLCSHVLEHIQDDAAALAEIGRVLALKGTAVVQVPVDRGRADTYEDASIVTAQGRLEAFGQSDHVRIYGRDVDVRFAASGLVFEAVDERSRLSDQQVARHGAAAEELLYVFRH